MSSFGVFLLSAGLAALSTASTRAIGERLDRRARARRAAERSHRSTIAEVAPGELARVVGRVTFDEEPLEAPFSGRACTHFEAVVERRNARGFAPKARTHSTRSFWLEDETGRIYVDASAGAIVDVVLDHHWTSREVDAETRFELERYLYQNGPQWNRLLGAEADLRYREGALVEGELVTVVGAPRTDRSPEPHFYRDKAGRVVLGAPAGGALYVSDGMHFQ
jgi:hypothetical protein